MAYVPKRKAKSAFGKAFSLLFRKAMVKYFYYGLSPRGGRGKEEELLHADATGGGLRRAGRGTACLSYTFPAAGAADGGGAAADRGGAAAVPGRDEPGAAGVPPGLHGGGGRGRLFPGRQRGRQRRRPCPGDRRDAAPGPERAGGRGRRGALARRAGQL